MNSGECPSCRTIPDWSKSLGSVDSNEKADLSADVRRSGGKASDDERSFFWAKMKVFGVVGCVVAAFLAYQDWQFRVRVEEWRKASEATAELFRIEGRHADAVCVEHRCEYDSSESSGRSGSRRIPGPSRTTYEITSSEWVVLLFRDDRGEEHRVTYPISSGWGKGDSYEAARLSHSLSRANPVEKMSMSDECSDPYVGKLWTLEYVASDPSRTRNQIETGKYPAGDHPLVNHAREAMWKNDKEQRFGGPKVYIESPAEYLSGEENRVRRFGSISLRSGDASRFELPTAEPGDAK